MDTIKAWNSMRRPRRDIRPCAETLRRAPWLLRITLPRQARRIVGSEQYQTVRWRMDTIRASQSIYAPTATVGRDTRNTYGNIHLADSTVSGVGMIKQPPAVLHGKKNARSLDTLSPTRTDVARFLGGCGRGRTGAPREALKCLIPVTNVYSSCGERRQ